MVPDHNIYITGLGVISPLGNSLEENHSALIQQKSGLSNLEGFDSKYASSLKFGEIKTTNQSLLSHFKLENKALTRTSLLALKAMYESVKDAQLTPKDFSQRDTALVVGNTVGGMCLTDELFQDANKTTVGSRYLKSYDCGSVTLFLQDHFGIKGVCNTINTACSSASNAIIYGARLIKNGYAKRAIVGGVDSLSKFTINGFNALGILSPENCSPFDQNRSGLNLGEGSGFLVLENAEMKGNKLAYATLSGYDNANDAHHPSSLSENGIGPFKVMKEALNLAKLSAHDIGYINTHGTGTENNDIVESTAMIRLFENVPAFASTKSKLGHTLGAAGAIESVYSILAIKHQEIYPSLNFSEPIKETGLIPVLKYQKMSLNHVMANSFGFGGNCSALIYSKLEA